jgi:hypothetical protein
MRRQKIFLLLGLALGLGAWAGTAEPAHAQQYNLNPFWYYPYYYFPHNFWPVMGPKWPEATSCWMCSNCPCRILQHREQQAPAPLKQGARLRLGSPARGLAEVEATIPIRIVAACLRGCSLPAHARSARARLTSGR